MRKRITMVSVILAIAGLTGCATLPGTSRAREAQELNTVKQVALACHMFAADHNEMLPSAMAQLSPYLGGDFNLNQVELVATGKIIDIVNPGSTVLLKSTSVSKAGKRAFAYVDGHYELLPEE